MPGTIIYYTIYDQLKVFLGFKENYSGSDNNIWAPPVAGAIARGMDRWMDGWVGGWVDG